MEFVFIPLMIGCIAYVFVFVWKAMESLEKECEEISKIITEEHTRLP